MVAIPATSTACKTRPQSFETVLRDVARLSETSLAFTLDRPAGLAFLAGQYVNLRVPGTEQRRSYSFSSAPGAYALSFLVRDIPGGLMSGWLRAAQPGAAMEFTGPSGSFYLRDAARPVRRTRRGGHHLQRAVWVHAKAQAERRAREARATN